MSKPRAPLKTARGLAISVLARVRATDAYLNTVLDAELDAHPLPDSRDAALVTELCYGVARRQLQLDAALETLADRPLIKIEDAVLAALRLGAYQLFFTRIPKHAAVSDTIEALKSVGLARASGFVNAMLRSLSRMETLPGAPTDPEAKLAWETSHPRWLVARWVRRYGAERARAMLEANNVAPPVVIRANSGRNSRAELLALFEEAGVKGRPTHAAPQGVVLDHPGRIEDLVGFDDGLFQVQDEAAQLVTVFAEVPAEARVLDACAAPGGKSCHLAETATVVSLDTHRHRLAKLVSESKRLGLEKRITLHTCDVSKKLPESLGEFDAVLLDAPCTGLGTLRRHPEIRFRRTEKDVVEIARLQRAMLESCAAVVKPGGLLVYAVCSTEPEEGVDQVEMFLRSHPDFTTEPPAVSSTAGFPLWQGHLRTLPGPEGWDGFFGARLRRMY